MARNPVQELRELAYGRYAITQVTTLEEERAERTLRALAPNLMANAPVVTWRCTEGLRGAESPVPDSKDPETALLAAAARETPALFLFFDLHAHFRRPEVIRALRDFEASAPRSGARLYMVSPVLDLPEELVRTTALYDLPLPSREELEQVLQSTANAFAALPGVTVNLTPADISRLTTAALGLTAREAQQGFLRAFSGRPVVDGSCLWVLYKEKESIVRKSQVMEFIPPTLGIDDVGGLEVLKEWLEKRRKLVSGEVKSAFIPVPKGILFMGVSGCGKSLSVKAISAAWQLPLFRLDMGKVYSGLAGNPERAFDRVLQTVEAVAPCILWVDEIENAIGGSHTSQEGGTAGRIFARFLTWMQEKTAMVFVAATANRIESLPAEILRKGRFDQLFFLDLPSEKDRMEIYRVHLARRGQDVARFNLVSLAKGSRNFSGSEIEQVVVNALTDVTVAGKPMTENDLFKSLGSMVPLATTMAEQIKAIKSWAHDRALKASKDGP